MAALQTYWLGILNNLVWNWNSQKQKDFLYVYLNMLNFHFCEGSN